MNNAKNLYLYHREGNYIPRVGAVHDLCGYGKCSLGAAIPVLSAAGCDVCPVPTGLFSAHTRFPTWYMHDTTDMLEGYLDAWAEGGVELDAIYSGFLGAAEQVQAIKRLYREHPKALRIVDPVMGDDGVRYPTYTDELCEAMIELVDGADVLTPNLTEASIISGKPYQGHDVDDTYVHETIDAILEKGAKNVVLKGIIRSDGIIRNYIAGADTEFAEVTDTALPFLMHGTGDLYASALLGAIMAGKSLYDAVTFAGELVIDAMKVSVDQPDHEIRGVQFELSLGKVTALLG